MEVFSFGLGEEPAETSAEVLGGKGAGLVWMDKLGVMVPPGFVVPTSACQAYWKAPKTTVKEVVRAMKPKLALMQKKLGYVPLLSVRSGARASMPGMMDTILNVGLDESNVLAWIKRLGNACVADSRRRLIEMFASVVSGVPRERFEGKSGSEMVAVYEEVVGQPFPGAAQQLVMAVEAVLKSWSNPRAKEYRRQNGIPEEWGTAVVVQAMVFGNMNDRSCTGVVFSRNPDTGADVVTGEFLVNAQGEDVVAGTRTPRPIAELHAWDAKVAEGLLAVVEKLEMERRDVQDVEFTVQDGKLYVLQTRTAKRSARAAVRVAVEMVESGFLKLEEVGSVLPYRTFLRAQEHGVDEKFKGEPAFTGIPACSGVVTGRPVFSTEEALAAKDPVVLVTKETSPDDYAGMVAARGVLTMTGGLTSHAAVVCRSMNRACVVGLGRSVDDLRSPPDGLISIDGATGRVWFGAVPVQSNSSEWVEKLVGMMVESTGVRLVGQADCDFLDLTGLLGDRDSAVAVVAEALKSRPSVVVDVRPRSSRARGEFDAMFPGFLDSAEEKLVKAVCMMVPGAKARAKFLTRVSHDRLPDGVQLVSTVRSAEDLVLASGDYVLEVGGPAVEKLCGWKREIEGSRPLRLGEAVRDVGVVSKIQLAQILLGG
jgi:pyruvate,orthophosphate dikinase